MDSYTNIVEEVVRGFFAERAHVLPLPANFITNIPACDVPKFIGTINPGVGYWWTQIDGQWYLSVPGPEHVNAFWSVFIICTVLSQLAVWLWDRRKAKLRGAN